MNDFNIHQFGHRWEVLKNQRLSLDQQIAVPLSSDSDPSMATRQSRMEPITVPLFGFVVTTITVAISIILWGYDKSNPGLPKYIWGNPEVFSIFCYIVLLLFYAWYITKYYREIWFPYYSLYEPNISDSTYFTLYGISIFVVSSLILMVIPEYWPTGFVVMFSILAIKKMKTRASFCRAADDYLNGAGISDVDTMVLSTNEDTNLPLWARQIIAARQLSISFSMNFIFWGIFIFGTISGLGIYYLLENTQYATTTGSHGHQVFSLILVTCVMVFYLMKIVGGIDRTKGQIERGEYSGFGLVRKFW